MEAQPQRCAGFSAVFNPVSQYAVCYPQRGGESQQRHHRACPPALPCAHHPTMPSVPQLGHQRVFQEEDQINSQKRPKVPKNQSSRKLQIVCNQKVRKVMFAPQLDHLPSSRLLALLCFWSFSQKPPFWAFTEGNSTQNPKIMLKREP